MKTLSSCFADRGEGLGPQLHVLRDLGAGMRCRYIIEVKLADIGGEPCWSVWRAFSSFEHAEAAMVGLKGASNV